MDTCPVFGIPDDLLTNAEYVENKTVLRRFLSQLVGHTVKTNMSVEVKSAHNRRFVAVVQLKHTSWSTFLLKYVLSTVQNRKKINVHEYTKSTGHTFGLVITAAMISIIR